MLTVLQRVRHAHISVNDEEIARINQGILLLCGFEKEDNEQTLQKMLDKCLHYRIFSDQHDKMNLSLTDINGDLLLVPQFTLVAETRRGLRPSFSNGASPEKGRILFEKLTSLARKVYPKSVFGRFAADMQITLCNDGPVTFILKFEAL